MEHISSNQLETLQIFVVNKVCFSLPCVLFYVIEEIAHSLPCYIDALEKLGE